MRMPLCITCKGKGLCGKPCPIIQRLKVYSEQIKDIGTNFSGSAPSVFVGRYGYPNVNVGILSPPALGEEAWKLDAPEFWYAQHYGIESVLEARSQLINTRNIANVRTRGKLMEAAQQIAMASKPVDTEFKLRSRPVPQITLDIRMPPVGAPALLENAKLTENPDIPRKVDAVVNDEIKAQDAVNALYSGGISVEHITKILSLGLLGMQKRIVPTRWAITATDDVVSKKMLEQIKDFPVVSEYHLFHNEYMGNHFEILLMPREWGFEVIEGKQPGSCWNPSGTQTYIYADWERHWGRKAYADSVTGAYYSDRLGVCEYLLRARRQASVLIVREVKPDYMIPCGVWVNREAVRHAFDKKPELFSDMDSALKRIFSRTSLPRAKVIAASQLLKEIRMQKRISDFHR